VVVLAREEGLQLAAEDLVEDAVLRLAAPVAASRLRGTARSIVKSLHEAHALPGGCQVTGFRGNLRSSRRLRPRTSGRRHGIPVTGRGAPNDRHPHADARDGRLSRGVRSELVVEAAGVEPAPS